ncbi:hypothetical protein [Streptacidiphilus sp. EB103A]|uniref:hypothetical protein n=1 Tax=Streptacidiphilus sp. EB103A TaxID=3156275 RepID=UPI0035122E58
MNSTDMGIVGGTPGDLRLIGPGQGTYGGGLSLTKALRMSGGPLRQFLAKEFPAGAAPLREAFRAKYFPGDRRAAERRVLSPPGSLGSEAGTVGTAIDQRLRLAFTAQAPLDEATLRGIEKVLLVVSDPRTAIALASVGRDLADLAKGLVEDMSTDDRSNSMGRARDDEDLLARVLVVAAWFAVAQRAGRAFNRTPLARTAARRPDTFTLQHALDLVNHDVVHDILLQFDLAGTGPLGELRAATTREVCHGGPVFSGMPADGDLLVDGLLIDFKSASEPLKLPENDIHQLLGYLLLDTRDEYGITSVGWYLTRNATLATWSAEDFLDHLGARKPLTRLRADVLQAI